MQSRRTKASDFSYTNSSRNGNSLRDDYSGNLCQVRNRAHHIHRERSIIQADDDVTVGFHRNVNLLQGRAEPPRKAPDRVARSQLVTALILWYQGVLKAHLEMRSRSCGSGCTVPVVTKQLPLDVYIYPQTLSSYLAYVIFDPQRVFRETNLC